MIRPTAYFDLDGCLVDSRLPIGEAIDETLSAFGVAPLRPGEVDAHIGPPIVEAFTALLAARGIESARAPEFTRAFRERYGPLSLVKTTLVPGIAGVLERLMEVADLLVVTSKAKHLAEPILDELRVRACFGKVFGPAADALDEPKATTLRRARAGRAASPADAMIGDRSHDVLAGRENGMRTIGVTWGIGSRSELELAGASVIIDYPEALLPLFS